MKKNEHIKLFVDAHTVGKEFQGARTFIVEIYNHLLSKYPQLDIYFGTNNQQQLLSAIPAANKSNILQYSPGIGLKRYMYDIPKFLKENEMDYAHFQYLVPIGKKYCRYIVTTHDILFMDFKKEF